MIDMRKLKPLAFKVAVLREKSKKMDGRIHIPDNAQKPKSVGTVIAIDEFVTTIKVDDRIIFPTFSGNVVEVADRQEVIFIDEEDVLATLEKDGED